jgi:hypothetical protein
MSMRRHIIAGIGIGILYSIGRLILFSLPMPAYAYALCLYAYESLIGYSIIAYSRLWQAGRL